MRYKMITTECALGTCPTITLDKQTGDLIVIGKLDSKTLSAPDIQAKIGTDETAVIVPKRLFSAFMTRIVEDLS